MHKQIIGTEKRGVCFGIGVDEQALHYMRDMRASRGMIRVFSHSYHVAPRLNIRPMKGGGLIFLVI